jgi:hypothetical protein
MGSLKVNRIDVLTETPVVPLLGLTLCTVGDVVFDTPDELVVNPLVNCEIGLPAWSVTPLTVIV